MIRSTVYKLFFITVLLITSFLSFGQNRSYWELNGNAGTSLFFGDIKQYRWVPAGVPMSEWRMGEGLQFGRQFSYVFGLRGQFLFGKLAGVKSDWDRYFYSDYFETNLNVTMNLNNLFGKNKRSDRFFNIYLYGGIGLTQYNTTVYELSTDKVLHKVGYGHGSGFNGRTLEGILVGGIGADFRINDNFRITLETANRAMNSDYMDHWDKGFKYDIYNYTSIGISWRFGLKNSTKDKSSVQGVEYSDMGTNVVQEQPKEESGRVSFDALTIDTEEHPVMPPEDTVVEGVVVIDTTLVQEDTSVVVETPEVEPYEEYRVQISAKYGKPLSIELLSREFNIPVDDIREDIYNGYYIYTVGPYKTYEEATQAKLKLRNEHGVDGAFTVGFRNGKRVDVRSLLYKDYKPEEGLEYRVQIAARYEKPVSLAKLSRRYDLPVEEIHEDRYNGFYIYTVGSFPTYKQAKDYKYELIDNNGATGAFVVAFRNGERLDSVPLDHE